MTDFAITIGGEPVTTSETFDVINPANGELAGKCPCGTADDVNEAVAAAKAAYPRRVS